MFLDALDFVAVQPEPLNDGGLDDLRVERQQDELRVEAVAVVEGFLDPPLDVLDDLGRVRRRDARRADHAIGDEFRRRTIRLRCGFGADRMILQKVDDRQLHRLGDDAGMQIDSPQGRVELQQILRAAELPEEAE